MRSCDSSRNLGEDRIAYEFTLTCHLPATPVEVYDAWLDSRRHSQMTGGAAKMSRRVDAAVSAWDGYITGKNLELTPGVRIKQSWRTSEFPDDHPDSTIVVSLAPLKSGCELTLKHTGVPDGQTSYELEGWKSQYFLPMADYFAKLAGKSAEVGRGPRGPTLRRGR